MDGDLICLYAVPRPGLVWPRGSSGANALPPGHEARRNCWAFLFSPRTCFLIDCFNGLVESHELCWGEIPQVYLMTQKRRKKERRGGDPLIYKENDATPVRVGTEPSRLWD